MNVLILSARRRIGKGRQRLGGQEWRAEFEAGERPPICPMVAEAPFQPPGRPPRRPPARIREAASPAGARAALSNATGRERREIIIMWITYSSPNALGSIAQINQANQPNKTGLIEALGPQFTCGSRI